MTELWRSDPDLSGLFLPDYPDDLQVLVHDGEPRRTQRVPEGCWVRVTGVVGSFTFPLATKDMGPPITRAQLPQVERTVYRGTLLNQPHALTSVGEGDSLFFLHAPGIPHPLQVTEAYLRERQGWAYVPCDACGADQSLDPPTVMARTRFPDAPAGHEPVMFTAFCPCGGTMVLAVIDEPPPRAAATADGPRKPWWKIWS